MNYENFTGDIGPYIDAMIDITPGFPQWGVCISYDKIIRTIEWFGYDPQVTVLPHTFIRILSTHLMKSVGFFARHIGRPAPARDQNEVILNQIRINPGYEDSVFIEELFHQIIAVNHPDIWEASNRVRKIREWERKMLGADVLTGFLYELTPDEKFAKERTRFFLENAPEELRRPVYWTQEPGVWPV